MSCKNSPADDLFYSLEFIKIFVQVTHTNNTTSIYQQTNTYISSNPLSRHQLINYNLSFKFPPNSDSVFCFEYLLDMICIKSRLTLHDFFREPERILRASLKFLIQDKSGSNLPEVLFSRLKKIPAPAMFLELNITAIVIK